MKQKPRFEMEVTNDWAEGTGDITLFAAGAYVEGRQALCIGLVLLGIGVGIRVSWGNWAFWSGAAILMLLLPSAALAETWKVDCNTCEGDPRGVHRCTTLHCAEPEGLKFSPAETYLTHQLQRPDGGTLSIFTEPGDHIVELEVRVKGAPPSPSPSPGPMRALGYVGVMAVAVLFTIMLYVFWDTRPRGSPQ